MGGDRDGNPNVGAHTLEIEEEGGSRQVSARYVVIAAGAIAMGLTGPSQASAGASDPQIQASPRVRTMAIKDDLETACAGARYQLVENLKAIEAGEIGKVITGELAGRQSDDQVTVFDSTGIALQDSATVPLEYERALAAAQVDAARAQVAGRVIRDPAKAFLHVVGQTGLLAALLEELNRRCFQIVRGSGGPNATRPLVLPAMRTNGSQLSLDALMGTITRLDLLPPDRVRPIPHRRFTDSVIWSPFGSSVGTPPLPLCAHRNRGSQGRRALPQRHLVAFPERSMRPATARPPAYDPRRRLRGAARADVRPGRSRLPGHVAGDGGDHRSPGTLGAVLAGRQRHPRRR